MGARRHDEITVTICNSLAFVAWGVTAKSAGPHGPAEVPPELGVLFLDPADGVAQAPLDVRPRSLGGGRHPAPASTEAQPLGELLRQERDLLARLAGAGSSRMSNREESARAAELLARLREASAGERQELLVEYVRQQAARILRLGADQLPKRRTGFFELGLDSLMAVELRNALGQVRGALRRQSRRRVRIVALLMPPSVTQRWRARTVRAFTDTVNAVARWRDSTVRALSVRRMLTRTR